MAAILLAGGPGAGKTTVSRQLRDRDLRSIDLDYGYARHEDETGAAVAFPAAPDLAWLSNHHWNWVEDRLFTALDGSADRTTVLAGTAYNMVDYLDRFDLLLVLTIGDSTLDTRVTAPDRDNDFGKTGDTGLWSRSWRRTVETVLAEWGAIAIDAERPVDQVTNDVAAACAAHGYPIASTD